MAEQGKKPRGGRKLVRTGKDKSYYALGFMRTERNKARRSYARKRRAAKWDGRPQKNAERIAARYAVLREERTARRQKEAEARAKREKQSASPTT